MKLYASSDVEQYQSPGCPSGAHERQRNRKGELTDERLVIDCEVCVAAILAVPALKALWSSDPEDIPLTEKERRAVERQKEQDMATTSTLANALSRQAADLVTSGKGTVNR
jgi:hypothetical protein